MTIAAVFRPPNCAVIFGSALTSDSPRDIDVAWSGDMAQAETAARIWAQDRGLDLPLDMHRVFAGRRVTEEGQSPPIVNLPAPMGIHGETISLLDPCVIEWSTIRSLTALMRTKPDLTESDVASLSHISMNLQTEGICAHREYEDWDDYVNGQRALQSAIRFVPGWAALVASSPLFAFLDALATRGASASGITLAEKVSSGGQAKIFIHRDTVRGGFYVSTQYGVETWDLAEAERIFVDPGPAQLAGGENSCRVPVSDSIVLRAESMEKDPKTQANGPDSRGRLTKEIGYLSPRACAPWPPLADNGGYYGYAEDDGSWHIAGKD